MSNKIFRVVLANPLENLTSIRIVILYRVSKGISFSACFAAVFFGGWFTV
jgi:hypothetical protein